MKRAVGLLYLLSLYIATPAHAAIYMCKDSSGRTFTSDRPIPQCADRALREYGNNGVMKREIAAPLSAEQRREKLAQEEKKKADQAAADEQRRADHALAARYRSEEDIAQARKRDSEIVNEQIVQQKTALSNAEKEWTAAQAAVEAQKKKGAIAAGLQYKLDSSGQSVRELKKKMQESVMALTQVNAKYDLTLQRYREISKTVSAQ